MRRQAIQVDQDVDFVLPDQPRGLLVGHVAYEAAMVERGQHARANGAAVVDGRTITVNFERAPVMALE